MADRNPARLLAPLALGAAVVSVVVVIAASRSETPQRGPAPVPVATTTERQAAPPRARTRFYVVKTGDTLTAIAESSGVALEDIERLNPEVDAQALQTGQRLRLTP